MYTTISSRMFQVYDRVYMYLLQLLHDSKRKVLSDGTVLYALWQRGTFSGNVWCGWCGWPDCNPKRNTYYILSYIYSVLWLTDVNGYCIKVEGLRNLGFRTKNAFHLSSQRKTHHKMGPLDPLGHSTLCILEGSFWEWKSTPKLWNYEPFEFLFIKTTSEQFERQLKALDM